MGKDTLISQATTPPLPEEVAPADATVNPKEGTVNIQLKNTTNKENQSDYQL